MTRSGLLAALLISAGPAFATPHLPVSPDSRVERTPPAAIRPAGPFATPLTGLPLTWESLRSPAKDAPLPDLCDAIRAGRFPDDARQPYVPAQVLSQLALHGYCGNESG